MPRRRCVSGGDVHGQGWLPIRAPQWDVLPNSVSRLAVLGISSFPYHKKQMKIVVFSDIHGDMRALDRLLDIEADYYFAAGDLVSWGRGLDSIGERLARHGTRVHVLPGNHETEASIAGMCERHGLTAFHGKAFEADGYHIAGLGCSTPTPFNTPGEYSEQEMARRLEPFAGLEPLILICHCPPINSKLDRMYGNTHAGSQAIRSFIETRQPAHFLCGHIHEAHGVTETIGCTMARNTGKQGYLLDFDKIKP